MRLGVYMDLEYTTRGGAVYADEAVILFVGALAERIEGLTFFGRLTSTPTDAPYPLPDGSHFVPFPHYESVTHLQDLSAASRGSIREFRKQLDGLDAVWLFGPHPLSLALAAVAHRHDTPAFLGVRQDFPRYIAGRLPSPLWSWAVPAAWSAEFAYRLLARRLPTVVVGDDLARKYRAGCGTVLAAGFSLIRAEDVATPDQVLGRSWDGPVRLLNVGRLGPEKNPTLLPEILARLRATDRRWQLAIAGNGPLAEDVRLRARELGVEGEIEMLGYVPNGPRLMDEYRRSHAFIHVSHTEGLPQVIFEAQAAGLPIVATDVGGVRQAVSEGEAGILIPPDDATAASAALETLRDDEPLRRSMTLRGLELAAASSLDVQLDRILEFFNGHVAEGVVRAPAPGRG